MPDPRVLPTSQPTDRPSFTVRVDASDLPREYHVASVLVVKVVNRISSARLVLLDGDPSSGTFAASSSDLFLPGKRIEVLVGYHSSENPVFAGIVVGHAIKARQHRPSHLIVECRHEAVKLSVGRRSACFLATTDSDVLGRILDGYGLTKHVGTTTLQHQELIQYASTDWDFLVSRAEANGMLVFTNDGAVKVKKPDFTPSPVLTLTYGATLLEMDAEMDARNQYGTVESLSWDCAGQEMIVSQGDEPSPPHQGNVDASSLAQVVGLDAFRLCHGGRIKDGEIKAWADAQMLKSRLARIRGRVKIQGFELNPGDLVDLNGLGDRFNGTAYITGVRHEITAGMWTTDVQFGMSDRWFAEEIRTEAPPACGLLPSVQGLQIGVVTQLQGDPDGEHRIRVRLPVVDPQGEGVWSRIATLDAGDERGSFFLPEIGDEVILGFLNEDPRQPVVLGMLHSSAKPAPLDAQDGNPQKGFVTRSKIKIVVDDEKTILFIETPAGHKLVLDDDAGEILMEDSNGNKITMGSGGVTFESPADVEIKATGDVRIEGVNIQTKASAQWKAEGSAGAELTTSATAVLRGSLVQIN